MKGYNVANNKAFGQRKSSFVDPLVEPAKRKLAVDREGSTRESTRDRESPTPHLFSQGPFNDKKHVFKPYDTPNYSITSTTNNSNKSLNKKYQKRDTPNRLPKLENVSASLKLTSKTEVIEIIAEKTQLHTPNNKDTPFHVHKMEATNPHSYYSKLPNLSTLGFTPTPLNPTTTSTTSTAVNKSRFGDPKNDNKLYTEDFKQVQDNIQAMQTLHKQHHVNTKYKISKINYNNSNSYNEDIGPTMQNLQEIENIQENIHQTQSLLQALQYTESHLAPPRSRNSTEYDDSPMKLQRVISTSLNSAAVLGSYLPRLVFRRFADVNSTTEIENKGTFFDNFWGVVVFADISGLFLKILLLEIKPILLTYVTRLHSCYKETTEVGDRRFRISKE
jgi:hypothetical protein